MSARGAGFERQLIELADKYVCMYVTFSLFIQYVACVDMAVARNFSLC